MMPLINRASVTRSSRYRSR